MDMENVNLHYFVSTRRMWNIERVTLDQAHILSDINLDYIASKANN